MSKDLTAVRSLLLDAPLSFREAHSDLSRGLAPSETLVRVEAGGICGSDGPFVKGHTARFGGKNHPDGIAPAGSPLHEVSGEVIATNDNDLRVGDKVVGWAVGFDGLAEYTITESASLARYSPRWSPTEATLIQPLACVIHAVDRLGDVAGQHGAVMGLGPIGLLFAHVLISRGARVSGVDVVDKRRAGSHIGIETTHHLPSARWATDVAPLDPPQFIVEAVGHQTATLNHAINAVAPSGTIMYFGVPDEDIYPIDMERVVRKHLTIMAGGTLNRRRALERANEYLDSHSGLADFLISDTFPISEAAEAYRRAVTASPDRHKVMISMEEWSR